MPDLDTLLRPKSVAVIGASVKGGPGTVVAANLLEFFPGDTYLINPRAPEIHGRRTYPTIGDLPAVPDLAVVALSGDVADRAVREAQSAGVDRFVGIANLPTSIQPGSAVGGNCLGYMNFLDGAHPCIHDLSDFMTPPHRGGVAVVSQSGGLLLALLSGTLRRNVGYSYCISSGDEQALGVEDYLEWLVESPDTEVIALILEGLRDGRRFLRGVSEAVRRGKPVVLFRIGRSSGGKASVAAHTGKIAGDDAVADALAVQFGAVVVADLGEMIETLAAMSGFAGRWPAGPRLGAAMISGGAAALVADFAEANELKLPPLPDEAVTRLESLLPGAAHVNNPLDISGGSSVMNPQTTLSALDTLAESGGYDAVMYVAPTRATGGPRFTKALMGEVLRHAPDVAVPALVLCPNPDAVTEHWYSVVQNSKIVALQEMRAGMLAVKHTCGVLAASRREQARAEQRRAIEHDASGEPGRIGLPDRSDLVAAGVPVVTEIDLSVMEPSAALASLGSAVAVKALSPSAPHKSEAGALRLGIDSAEGLQVAQAELSALARRSEWADVQIVAQPMITFDREYIVSAIRDVTFGVTLVIGLGGNLVELIPNASVMLSTEFTADDLDRALSGSMVGTVMQGYRGASAVDRRQLIELLAGLGELMARYESAQVIELNPVVVEADTGRLVALDYLVE